MVVFSFAYLADLFNETLKNGEPFRFVLDAAERKVVVILKGKLVTSPMLALPQKDGQYTVETDACDN